MSAPPKRVVDVLQATTDYLAGREVENPRLAGELLLSRLLGCKRLELYLRYETVLGEKHLAAMRRGVRRVGDGEPVQYVTGEVEFFGHVFKVDRRALIPRPETEDLVQAVLDCEALWQKDHPAVADVGTGTGCIAVALAVAKPAGRYLALDRSEEALALARENATRLRVGDAVTFKSDDLPDALDEPESLDAIVANLPYVTTAEYERLPRHIREHEPREALDGGEDGLRHIGTVIHDASFALRKGGRIFLEIGYQQAEAVNALLLEAEFTPIEVRQDFGGRDRVVWGQLAGSN